MDEVKEISQSTAKISKLAIASLVLGLFGPLWGFLVLIICFALFDYDSIFLGFAAAISYLTIWLPAHLIGQKAIHKISTSKGLLRGTACAKVGVKSAIVWAVLLPVLFFMSILFAGRAHQVSPRMICGSHIAGLGKQFAIYANEHDAYPAPDKWCDALLQGEYADEKMFKCPGNKKARCSYSMNPNCDLNSPPNVVLLFESNGGWNSFGGPELFAAKNHTESGGNILFNDGHVAFVKADPNGQPYEKLNWGEKTKGRGLK